jgi:NAD(P)-dependent dehydrogenase (short-subunit alcohol dehydrogenase family)
VELGWEVIGTVHGNGTELPFETVHCDVTDDEAVARLGQYVFERWGRLDALVNNAGISLTGAMEELDPKEVRTILDVNLVAPMALARACLPALRAASGVIIQISSVSGYSSSELFGAYQASKFGLEGASEALQEEVSGQNVRVVLIEPGAFRTEIAVKGIQAGAKGSTGLYESSWVEVDAWLQWHATAGPNPAECVAAIVGAATLRCTISNPRWRGHLRRTSSQGRGNDCPSRCRWGILTVPLGGKHVNSLYWRLWFGMVMALQPLRSVIN